LQTGSLAGKGARLPILLSQFEDEASSLVTPEEPPAIQVYDESKTQNMRLKTSCSPL